MYKDYKEQVSFLLKLIKQKFIKLVKFYQNFFSNNYLLKLESIELKSDGYVLIFRVIQSTETLQIKASSIRKEHNIIQSISPIDAYLCGIVEMLHFRKISLKNTDFLLEYFAKQNNGKKIPALLWLYAINLGGKTTFIVKPKCIDHSKEIPYKEIARKPFILQGLSSRDAMDIGVASANRFIGEICD